MIMKKKDLANFIHILNIIPVIIEGEKGSSKSLSVEITWGIISNEREGKEIDKQPYRRCFRHRNY